MEAFLQFMILMKLILVLYILRLVYALFLATNLTQSTQKKSSHTFYHAEIKTEVLDSTQILNPTEQPPFLQWHP